ncbi:hypothetical protein AC578_145 [Pseudocercospora eumusae]|uniref:Uncharacterized protein n=1 Tax=Pseudocercospora eumusae TaxID=321146 RepID=A0A139GTP4_9PEZI|nr:hypothetical protein AC578_145 [Pseudocercospora eumusae]
MKIFYIAAVALLSATASNAILPRPRNPVKYVGLETGSLEKRHNCFYCLVTYDACYDCIEGCAYGN